jgi:glycolate oxidase FAD binding subunit
VTLLSSDYFPSSEEAAAEIVRDAWRARRPLVIRGGGTRSGLGRQVQAEAAVSTRNLTGITLYEPAEMVMSVRAGTTMREIEEQLALKRQMLPFEPMDHRLMYGTDGEPTIGGVVACNISGPRRIKVGAARDCLLGVRFVNGRGEVVKSGGRVMKNVTGLDLVRLSCGAYGSLGLLTEVTLRLLPTPEYSATLVLGGLTDVQGVTALSAAMGSPFDVSGAAHLPAGVAMPLSQTLIRVEGAKASVVERLRALRTLLAAYGPSASLDADLSRALWQDVRDVKWLRDDPDIAIWRISVKPNDGPKFVSSVGNIGMDYYYNWSGGLIWLAVSSAGDASQTVIRSAVRSLGGHATLVRSPVPLRASLDVFEPLSEPLMKVTAGIKKSFDPGRILNPAIMYTGL